MSEHLIDDVAEFHEACGFPCPERAGFHDALVTHLWTRLLREEYMETLEAVCAANPVALADGLADLIVVALGFARTHGIPMQRVWDEVHRSNMAKIVDGRVLRRADGKILKPDGWTGPDVEGCLR